MYAQVWDDVINKGQIDKINSTHFDTNVTGISSPENIVGIENFKAFYQNYLTGFSEVTFTIKNIFGQGDNIVKHWQFKGKHTGEFFGIPATGKNVNIEGVTLVKMKNGKILQEQDFMDNTLFMQQLGLVSDPNNVTTIDNLYKAFAVGDIPTVLGGMDANIVWNEAESNRYADGNPYTGPDAVLNGVFARIGAEYEYFKLEDIKLHEMSNNQVLATLRYDAKFKETGKTYNAQVAHLWTLKDGKVVAFQQFLDTKKVADAEKK
ncbi:MAG: hypothetical protein CVU08_07770 [Bacteroidetes bacterium HGW-Bacteroidetes-3]|nr:MAG: hypothetical protein CVU08_07770 [Bacteroidetes bacterium HGW-Bacteroidetes-3]